MEKETPTLKDLVRKALLDLAAANKNGTQAWLAGEVGVTEPFLSKTLNGGRPATDREVIRMAAALEIAPEPLLFAAGVARCETRAREERQEELTARQSGDTKKETAHAQAANDFDRAAASFRALLSQRHAPEQNGSSASHATRSFVSLEDFPHMLGSKWAVIAGDRREQRPKGPGDLVALSASTSDFMFFAGLKLPPDSLMLSDKIIRIASSDNLEKLLAKRNLLIIGSPAVNLLTRKIMSEFGATMMFNIAKHWYDRELRVYDALKDWVYEEETAVDSELEKEINQILPNFMKSGFVDPIEIDPGSGWLRAVARRGDRDYGIIALAENPWSKDHVACICAGVGGGGTAGALKLLGNPSQFAGHPWGGVFKVNLPSQVAWEMRFRNLWPKWDTKEYTPEEYVRHAQRLIERIEAKDDLARDVTVDIERLKKMVVIGKRLREAHGTATAGD